ncbi:MarR family winged helix-turn-helix transcriptional regulator [Sandaracinobacteroides saxicola]|uniref:Winged helix-turn-helix transcriptional regulator n=1 Tax=Sandaracinobacteroides saxicola TaxID=2759707 RepID=A0A7G5IGT2_9SPHN|nr:MarR family winged helix-turn-helix transcriptional regulator [Sandaracinobacteroides saxicola]QMW22574.1 winged helix-turn-helix transcriptional regulator [Sandaracinobacteroides saxicola]
MALPHPAETQCLAMRARKLARRVNAIYDAALAPHGMTIGQFGLLGRLRRSRARRVMDLADDMMADASTLSRLLKPLIAEGLVVSETDPYDARARALRLTNKGAARVRAALAGWETADRQVSARLGEDRAELHRAIDSALPRL